MKNTEQNRQEYREALEKLKFSQDAKRRLVYTMTAARQAAPRFPHRPLRRAAVIAALCVLLTITAAAAMQWRNSLQFADTLEEAARLAGNQPSGTAASVGTYSGDWEYRPPVEEVAAWWSEFETHKAAEAEGTPDDGWTKKRSYREGKAVYTRYLGSRLSDFDGLWESASWNMEWIEDKFTPVADAQSAYTCHQNGELQGIEFTGAYTGKDGAAFTIQYKWDSSISYGDSYLLSGGLETSGQYTTADGVEVAIGTARSQQGDLLFWASYVSGHRSFSMSGKQMELETIREILDSLKLSGVCAAD